MKKTAYGHRSPDLPPPSAPMTELRKQWTSAFWKIWLGMGAAAVGPEPDRISAHQASDKLDIAFAQNATALLHARFDAH